jgi:hypothetical protein
MTIPTQRHPAEDLPRFEQKTFPTLWVCPTCKDPVRVCDKPACITAEIDHDYWQDLNGDHE